MARSSFAEKPCRYNELWVLTSENERRNRRLAGCLDSVSIDASVFKPGSSAAGAWLLFIALDLQAMTSGA